MLITVVFTFRPEGHQELRNERLVPKPRQTSSGASGVWTQKKMTNNRKRTDWIVIEQKGEADRIA